MNEASINQGDLPNSWALTNLGSVINYGSTSKAEPNEIGDDDWVLELEDIEKDSSRLLKKMTFLQRQSKSTKNHFEAGDVLYGKLRPYLNKVLIADEPGYCTTEILPLKVGPHIDNRYLFYWLKHPAFLKYVEAESHGMNMPRLGTETGKAAPFVLAPRSEQTRIANQLDTLLDRVQTCNDRFDAIPALLKRFRQTVTNSACFGELSAEWRGTSDLKGWKSQALANVCNSITDGDHQAPPQADSGVPFITISAMNDGRLRLEKASRFVPQSYFDSLKPSRRPERGDILFSVTGSIGIPAQVDTDEPFTFQRHIAILKPNKSLILSSFIALALGSEAMRTQVKKVATGTAQLTIPLSGIRAFVVNLPPIDEQTEIVRRVEAMFALADRIEARCTVARAQAQRLTPLVLAKAFRGELVQQDQNDIPAFQLLAQLGTKVVSAVKKRQVIRSAKRPIQTTMKNSDKETIKLAILDLKPGSYLFEELRMKVNGDYELIKTALFELLEDSNPSIQQEFDEKAGSLKLVRVRP